MYSDRGRSPSDYMPLRDAMNRLLEGSVITPHFFTGQAVFPPADIYVSDDAVIIELAVPGATSESFDISVTGDTIVIGGEIKRPAEEQRGRPIVQEIGEGKFQRTFTLDIPVDSGRADASLDNGILTLTLPKTEAMKPRKIQVGQGQPAVTGESRKGKNLVREKVPVESSES